MSSNVILEKNPRRRESVPDWPIDGSPLRFHRRLPGYEATPLMEHPGMAADLGVARVLIKDESSRLGLPAFKMLGASWASYRALSSRLGIHDDDWSDVDDLRALIEPHRPLELVAATDGNHGRAVARTARILGLSARIAVPAATSKARIDAIVDESADLVVIDGHYDEAVATVAGWADDRTLVVSDTSWEGYEDEPRHVIDGYSTIFAEVASQSRDADLPEPTVIPIPLGVGALGVAVIRYAQMLTSRPTMIGVEPTEAACVQAALAAGHVLTIESEFRTSMAGLNCGTASRVAYPVLAAGLDWTVAMDDEWAEQAMRVYAGAGLEVGETGASTLGCVLALIDRCPEKRHMLGLDSDAVLLLLVTEGPTDPVNYRRIIEGM